MKKKPMLFEGIEEVTESSAVVKKQEVIDKKYGKLIVFEGGEGSGKSTQLERLFKYFKQKSAKTVLLREPGGTPISEKIRSVILDRAHKNMSEKTELLLYIACRAQIVEEKLKPLIEDGYTVLLDRFYLATIVYQGYARGIDRKWIDELNRYSLAGLKEDFTVIYDVTLSEAAKRMKKRVKRDRLDEEASEFHKKVRDGYLKEAKKMDSCVVISTDNKDEDCVFKETIFHLERKGII
jgi:dTMP kinase